MSKDLTGVTLGRYQIRERLGRGGMAEVYRAFQPSMDRYVAVKTMHAHLAEDPEFVTRFRREAQAVGSLRHPNIVQVMDFDSQDDVYYMVMEFIQGDTLKALVQKRGALPVAQALDICAKLADALAYAHSQGMIHRDIKPANVLMNTNGEPILTDFGVARILSATNMTASGVAIGTPAYMSPEAGRGEQVDERADIYSLGVVLYEMLVGHAPFDADTPYAVIMKHISAPLTFPPEVAAKLPDSVERLVLKSLTKNPADRYQTAAAFRDAIKTVRGTLDTEMPTSAGKGATKTRAGVDTGIVGDAEKTILGTAEPLASNRRPLLMGAAVLIVLIVIGGIFLVANGPRPTATTPAAVQPSTAAATPAATAAASSQATQPPTTAPSGQNAKLSIPPNTKYADLFVSARQDLMRRNTSDAYQKVDAALKDDPQNYDLLVLHAITLIETGADNREPALKDAEAAQKLAPERPDTYLALGMYNHWVTRSDQAEERVKQLKKALDYYNQAVQKGSTDYYVYWYRGIANDNLNGYLGAANNVPETEVLADFDLALKLYDQDPRVHASRGAYFFERRKWPDVQKSYEMVIALNPDEVYFAEQLAVTLLAQGQKQKAFDVYTTYLKRNNLQSQWDFLARASFFAWSNGTRDKAKEWAALALALEPKAAVAIYVQALLDWDDKKYEEALKKLEALVDVGENGLTFNPTLFDRDLYIDRARLLVLLGKPNDALPLYTKAIEQHYAWLTPMIEQGKLYKQLGKVEDSQRVLRDALRFAIDQKDEKARIEILDLLK